MMGSFGKFLEISLPSGDVLRSLNFYRELGFSELPTGDIRPWHYAVVTDGSIHIGLHGGGLEEPALCFVRPNLARQVQVLEAAGHVFESCRLGTEEFHEATLRSPDGHLVQMIEARTFSTGTALAGPASLIGRCTEVSLACVDVAASSSFYEAAGFLEAGSDEEVVRLNTPGITLALHASARPGGVALRFRAADPGAIARSLAARQISVTRDRSGPALRAPEGTRLAIG